MYVCTYISSVLCSLGHADTYISMRYMQCLPNLSPLTSKAMDHTVDLCPSSVVNEDLLNHDDEKYVRVH